MEKKEIRVSAYRDDANNIFVKFCACPDCGNIIDPHDNYCRYCGQKLWVEESLVMKKKEGIEK